MQTKLIRLRIIVISLLALLCLTHCSAYDFARRPVQQGNLLPPSKLLRLKLGMSKEEVAILMGTSLLSPVFNENRWDYAYTFRRGNGPTQVRNVSLYFHQDRLIRLQHRP